MTEISHEELMMQFQQGNVHAFELLFEQFRAPVFNFLYRMLNRQKDAAEDLLQEVFVKVIRAKDFYEPSARFSTWLFTIARNHCLNFIKSRRYRQREETLSLNGLAEESSPALSAALPVGGDTRRELERREIVEILEAAIGTLPDAYREAFLLHAVQGFSHEEIARISRTKPATVRIHYHRARKMLRDRTGGVFGERTGTPESGRAGTGKEQGTQT